MDSTPVSMDVIWWQIQDFILETSTMNPDQTAPLSLIQVHIHLQYWLL